MSGNEKSAQMSPENKEMLKKYLKMGLGSAVLAAGIGAYIRRRRANKEREDAMDASKSKNTITIPVNIDTFMEGVPTKEQQASSVKPKQVASMPKQSEMTQDEIRAKKKEILGGSRRFNFFGKKAEKDGEDEDGGKESKDDTDPIVSADAPKSNDKSEPKDVLKVSTKEKKEESPLPPRNALGQFTSPTDPTGVVEQEKTAEWNWSESGKNLFFHPWKTLGGMWDSATTRPLYITAGGIGSVVLASMIVDKVNEIRARRAKSDAEASREKYVKILNGEDGSEKKAQEKGYRDTESPISAVGTLLGASFIVPTALAAIVANKIMDNRKAEKEKKKRMASSIPEEPTFLYRTYSSKMASDSDPEIIFKTASGDKVEISPETAIALLAVKKAMIMGAEASEDMEKKAFGEYFMRKVVKPLGEFAGTVKDTAQNAGNAARLLPALEFKDGKLTDNSYNTLAGDDYDEHLFNFINGWMNNDKGMTAIPGMAANMKAIASDPRTLELLSKKFSNSNAMHYDKRWGKLQDDIIDRELGETFGNEGLGGMFKSILSWLAKNTGIGGWMFRKGLASKLGTQFPDDNQQNATPTQTNAGASTQGTNATTTQTGAGTSTQGTSDNTNQAAS